VKLDRLSKGWVEEISLCTFCNCMTKTIRKQGLSASENKHYRYECGKCGAKKELEIIRRAKCRQSFIDR
jgi:predicted SprT family Zn-dependent metalloprotease